MISSELTAGSVNVTSKGSPDCRRNMFSTKYIYKGLLPFHTALFVSCSVNGVYRNEIYMTVHIGKSVRKLVSVPVKIIYTAYHRVFKSNPSACNIKIIFTSL